MEEKKKLLRPRSGRMLSGVCAGIANFFGLDVTLVRVAYVLLSLFSAGFPGILLYFILLIIIPEEPNKFIQNQ
ncbi:MAG: PspC domain-containing protein [Mediterranea massiliensis]|nr:PspC domain-containing protein [Mediterranea massiliensis]